MLFMILFNHPLACGCLLYDGWASSHQKNLNFASLATSLSVWLDRIITWDIYKCTLCLGALCLHLANVYLFKTFFCHLSSLPEKFSPEAIRCSKTRWTSAVGGWVVDRTQSTTAKVSEPDRVKWATKGQGWQQRWGVAYIQRD